MTMDWQPVVTAGARAARRVGRTKLFFIVGILVLTAALEFTAVIESKCGAATSKGEVEGPHRKVAGALFGFHSQDTSSATRQPFTVLSNVC